MQVVLIMSLVYLCLKYIFWPLDKTSTGIMLPLVSGNSPNQSHQFIVNQSSAQKKNKSNKRKRGPNDDDTNDASYPKRKRSSKYHPDSTICLPCAIWKQSGSDVHLQEFHPVDNSRHAGLDALSISQYASFNDTNFNLESNDCICHPCYRDYTRNKNNKENKIPRWEKIRQEYYAQEARETKHCVYCCGSSCDCEHISQWGPEKWYGEDNLSTWKQYLSLTGIVDYPIGDHINHIC